MSFVLSLLSIVAALSAVYAQTCWRNTSCTGPSDTAFPGVWQSNIYAPSSRSVKPKVYSPLGAINSTKPYAGSFSLPSNGSATVFDFGIEVGGIVSLSYTATGAGAIGLAFTEAKNYVGKTSDFSNGGTTPDGAIYANFTSSGSYNYTMPLGKLRGGFRYLTLFINNTHSLPASVTINDIDLEIGFQPTWSNLRAYQGYFHSNNEMLNKIWYSGAYTLQTNAVPVNTGRRIPQVTYTWENDGLLGNGSTIIVDGAKRDRAVWPGDMGIAVPSSFVSIGDLDSVRNALQVMYDYQNADGSFPEAGPPLLQQGSDTYHMWTMIGTYNYMLYNNDTAFLQKHWAQYQRAMNYVYAKVQNNTGLLYATGLRDWARESTGGNNTEANMILYRTLITGASLAQWSNDATLSATWLARASSLQSAIITHCWDASYGAFKDNATATPLHPQDANSMALLFGVLSPNDTKAQSVSAKLLNNWTPIGPVTPELPNNISPFISSFELQGHLQIGQTQRALELLRTLWGWYLNNPNGTQSTVVEGYLANGTWGYRYNRGYSDFSYTSHSHGWSSGPTSALTEYILGLSVTDRAGSTWRLSPQFGDLKSVEGGFTTVLGKFQASWQITGNGYVVTVSTPTGTTGTITLPPIPSSSAAPAAVQQHGRDVKSMAGYKRAAAGSTFSVDGGEHTFTVG